MRFVIVFSNSIVEPDLLSSYLVICNFQFDTFLIFFCIESKCKSVIVPNKILYTF